MSKIDEKMLMMMVDMAAQGGKMEALQEAKDREIEELRTVVDELRSEIAKRDKRIAQLEALVFQQENARPQVVVNQFFMLSVPRTRVYVSSLSNNGRQFVGHMLHHTLAEDTPRYVMDEVDEMTQLRGNTDDRLADAIEELAKKPTTQNNYGGDYVEGDKVGEKTEVPNVGNYNAYVHEQNNTAPLPPIGQQEQQKRLDYDE